MSKARKEKLYSVSAAARKLRRTRRTIEKAVETVRPVEVHGLVKKYGLQDVIAGLDQHTFAPINPQRAALKASYQGVSLASERAKLMQAQRLALEERSKAFSGKYFSRDLVTKKWDEYMLVMREIVLSRTSQTADIIATVLGVDRASLYVLLSEADYGLLEHLSNAPEYDRTSSKKISPDDPARVGH